MEYNKLCDRYKIGEFMNSLEYVFKYEIDDLQFLGVGAAQKNENRSYYIVCKSGKLKDIRDRYELPERDFHITLGFLYRDVFGVRKNEVMNVPSKFIKLLKEEFLKKENFNFIRYLDNFDGNEDSEIIPISISDTYLKIKCDDFLMDIGFSESENKLSIFTNYNSESEAKRLPLTEFLKFIKNNN